MSIALDITVLIVISLTAFFGYKRGFVRSVLRLLGTIACVVVALIVSDMAAGPAYRNILAPRVESALLGKLENFDITAEVRSALNEMGANITLDDKQLKKVLSDSGSLPSAFERAILSSGGNEIMAAQVKEQSEDFFTNGFSTALAKRAGIKDYESLGERVQLSLGKVYDLVRAFATGEDNKAGVHYLVYNILDNLLTTIIRYALFVVILIVLEIIVSIVFKVAGVLDHLPAISGANKTLGLIFGIIKGVLFVGLFAAIMAAIVKSDSIMDSQVFDDTIIFKAFFNFFYK